FGESRVHGEGGVRAGQHLVDDGGERAWRALPAVLLVDGEDLPPGLVELLPGLLEAGRRDDLAVLEPAADLVADRVERPGDLAREAIELAERQLDLGAAPVLEGRLAEDLLQAELLEEDELQLAEACAVAVLGSSRHAAAPA